MFLHSLCCLNGAECTVASLGKGFRPVASQAVSVMVGLDFTGRRMGLAPPKLHPPRVLEQCKGQGRGSGSIQS